MQGFQAGSQAFCLGRAVLVAAAPLVLFAEEVVLVSSPAGMQSQDVEQVEALADLLAA